MKKARLLAVLTLSFLFINTQVLGADLIVLDAQNKPLTDAVIYFESVAGTSAVRPTNAVIEQKNKQFIPLVSVVTPGSSIQFPNNDTVRHHAYSFSPAGPFELKLYIGKPSNPVVFDKVGTVVIGCNIHDQMVAYIHIVNTPWYAKTNAQGQITVPNLPSGQYKVKVWHWGQSGGPNSPPAEFAFTKETLPSQIKVNFVPVSTMEQQHAH